MSAHPPSCNRTSLSVRVRGGVSVKALALKSNHEFTTKHTFHTPQTRQFNADLIHSIQSDQTQSSNGEETDSSSDSESGPLCDKLQEHAKVMKHKMQL